jgi:putative hydrolase of the HAD superfamily
VIRSILFDFGNVIGFFDHRRATRQFAQLSDMPEGEMLEAIYDGPLEHDFESGRISGDTFLTKVCELIGYRGPIEQLAAKFVDIFTPNAPAIELIPKLAKSHRLVLCSNTNELHSAKFRQAYADTLLHFHALGMSWQAGVRKPHSEFFHYCLRLAECEPDEAVFVDDVEINVEGARAIGIPGIVYEPGMDLVAELKQLGVSVD